MAITIADVGGSLADTGNVASYAKSSWTPVAGHLYLATVANSDAANAILPTLSGNGQTWTQVATQQQADGSSRITLFRCLAASPTTGTLVADFAADNQTGCIIQVSDVQGFQTGGTNGSAAIVQAVPGVWASVPDPVITLAAFADAGNATFGAFFYGGATLNAIGAGFTQLGATLSYATPTRNYVAEWQAGNDTTVDLDLGTGSGVGIALELAVLVAAAPDRAGRRPMKSQNVAAQFAARW